jgi:hypothetical protein
VSWLSELWHRLADPQPDPPPALVLATGVLVLAVVLARRPWRLARNVITIAHEGGHALVAVLTGRRLKGIRLHTDTSGLTLSAGRPTGPGMAVTLFAGYVSPSLLGLAGAVTLGTGRITALLWLTLALLLAMLVMVRNVYGAIALLATMVMVFSVSWFASPAVQAAFAYAGVWFLLLGGVKPIRELQRLRRHGRLPDSDADQLAGVTRVPALVWVGMFGVVNLAALGLGGLLLGQPVGAWLQEALTATG